MNEYNEELFGDRLRLCRKNKGVTQAVAAKAVGMSQTNLSELENGLYPTSSFTPMLADYYGVASLWLANGKGKKELEQISRLYKPAANMDQNTIFVEVLENAGSMGDGAAQLDSDIIAGTIPISREWVGKTLPSISNPGSLRFIHGLGDSMSPTFQDGDVLLVDTAVHDPGIDGVYVLQVNGQLFIKRVSRRFDGRHEISSDNPSVKTIEALNGDHSVEVKGRVVWAWNGKRL